MILRHLLGLPSKLSRTEVAKTLAIMVVSTRRRVGESVKNVDNIELSEVVAIFRGVPTENLRFHKL